MFNITVDDELADVYSILSIDRDETGTDFLIWYKDDFVWMPSYRCKLV